MRRTAPNKPAAPNAGIASPFEPGLQWRGVGDPARSSRARWLAEAESGGADGALLTAAAAELLPEGTHAHVPDDAAGTAQEQPLHRQPAPEPARLALKREPRLEATLLKRRILDLGTPRRPGRCDVVVDHG